MPHMIPSSCFVNARVVLWESSLVFLGDQWVGKINCELLRHGTQEPQLAEYKVEGITKSRASHRKKAPVLEISPRVYLFAFS